MVFVFGGIASGKRAFADSLGVARQDIAPCMQAHVVPCAPAIRDAQNLVDGTESAETLEALADALAEKSVVIANEVGLGVVPADAKSRAQREAAGRLACLIAERADTVVRTCCGIPQTLKGGEPGEQR